MKHSWSQPSRPNEHETHRACEHCGIIKVTRHEPGSFSWTEFLSDTGCKLYTTRTPECLGRPLPLTKI